MNANQFSQLDAQSAESRFAHMSALEHQEAAHWLDEWNAKMDAALEVRQCGICGHNHAEHACPVPAEEIEEISCI